MRWAGPGDSDDSDDSHDSEFLMILTCRQQLHASESFISHQSSVPSRSRGVHAVASRSITSVAEKLYSTPTSTSLHLCRVSVQSPLLSSPLPPALPVVSATPNSHSRPHQLPSRLLHAHAHAHAHAHPGCHIRPSCFDCSISNLELRQPWTVSITSQPLHHLSALYPWYDLSHLKHLRRPPKESSRRQSSSHNGQTSPSRKVPRLVSPRNHYRTYVRPPSSQATPFVVCRNGT